MTAVLAVAVPAGAQENRVPASPVPAAAAEPFALSVGSGELARRAAVQLKSRVAMIVRADNGEVLYRKNSNDAVPIASITKLMTAMIVLDADQPMDEVLRITNDDIDRLKGTPSRLAVGTKLTRAEFLQLSLMSSENRAASVLARNYPGGRKAAITAMNRKARALGMTKARFADGTGLSPENRASPTDLVRMVKAADAYPLIREYSTAERQVVRVGRQLLLFNNTNSLVRSPNWEVELTKTGYTNEAGRCLVMQARIAGQPVILVLMDSYGTKTRIGDANRVRQWLEAAWAPARSPAKPEPAEPTVVASLDTE